MSTSDLCADYKMVPVELLRRTALAQVHAVQQQTVQASLSMPLAVGARHAVAMSASAPTGSLRSSRDLDSEHPSVGIQAAGFDMCTGMRGFDL